MRQPLDEDLTELIFLLLMKCKEVPKDMTGDGSV